MNILTGWIIPILTLVVVVALLGWCFRIFLSKTSDGTEKILAFLMILTISLTCIYYGFVEVW